MNRKSDNTWSRRWLLGRGMTGAAATALAPFIPVLERTADAEGVPKRVVLVFWSGGAGQQYLPTGTETSFTFSPDMASLEPWKQKLIVLGNLRRAQDNSHGSHQAGTAGVWTAGLMKGTGPGPWVSSPSINRIIAKAVPQSTPFPTLELDVQSADASNLRGNTTFDVNGQAVRGEQDPSAAFDRLFTDGVSLTTNDPAMAAKLRARRKSILDTVGQEITTLSGQLGGADRTRLNQHLASLRAAELRLTEPETTAPGFTPPSRASIPMLDFKAQPNFPAVAKAHLDILVAAVASDRTRIANLQCAQGNSQIVYSWIGVRTPHHSLTHQAENPPGLDTIRKWYYDQFASLLARMDAVKEANGSLLDNSLVVFANEFVSGFTHDTDPWPVILAGSGGGRFKTGRFLNFPMQTPNLPRLFPGALATAASPSQTQLLTSICNYMGANVARVGDETLGPPGPLTALG
jgi:hypothetical protein